MDLAPALKPYLSLPRWWIAYSGGVDSHVLLHAISQLRDADKNIPPLAAVHINHQLNPKASEWAQHCQAVCAQLGIELLIEKVDVARDSGAGIESAARSARYAAFERHVQQNEVLLQAHHADDQVETLLLRLLRGSGISGLTAIPAARALGRGRLLRPLLNASRADILDYARRHHLSWVEDDSNQNADFDRNFLRLRVLPQLAERWPAYRSTLARVIEQAGEAEQLLDALAAQDFAAARAEDNTVSTAACLSLDSVRRRNLLRYWLQQAGLPLPSREQLRQIEAMLEARIDAEPCVQWPGAEVHRFRDALYAMQPLPPVPAPIDAVWNPLEDFVAPGMGILRARPLSGRGLRADRDYRIRNRRGGERCKPVGRAHSQTLKKLLQEYAVLPWLRDRLPLIYCGDELAAVADLWICDGFAAGAGQSGWDIAWNLVNE
jgi:tRNA(Ile)-lysidine synthase